MSIVKANVVKRRYKIDVAIKTKSLGFYDIELKVGNTREGTPQMI